MDLNLRWGESRTFGVFTIEVQRDADRDCARLMVTAPVSVPVVRHPLPGFNGNWRSYSGAPQRHLAAQMLAYLPQRIEAEEDDKRREELRRLAEFSTTDCVRGVKEGFVLDFELLVSVSQRSRRGVVIEVTTATPEGAAELEQELGNAKRMS